ncbi:hypothetical protein FQZ97_578050 [compost metagenome]
MTNTNDERRYAELTREALADVREGLVIDHKLVETWAKSLDGLAPIKPDTGTPLS